VTDYVSNNQTGVVFEVEARTEDGRWLWLRDAAGIMHSAYASGYTDYAPTPTVGEVWTDEETGGPVVVVGEKDGQPVVVEVVDGTKDVVHVAYRRDPGKLKKPNIWPARVDTTVPDGPGPDVPDETPKKPVTPPVTLPRTPPATDPKAPKGGRA
jgi:hypothetical protein